MQTFLNIMQYLLADFQKLIEYSASAVIVVSSKPCKVCSKNNNIFSQSKFGNEKSQRESNRIPYFKSEHLCGSSFLANLTAPKKKHFRVKTMFKSRYDVSNL